jgi:methionyl-tRNA synthetase
MVNKYFEGNIPSPKEYSDADKKVIAVAQKAVSDSDAAMQAVAINEAIASIWTLVDELNNYITVQEPWALAKDEANRDRLATVLFVACEGLRVLSVLLSPITPKATAKLWAALTEGKLGELSEQILQDAGEWGQLDRDIKVSELEVLFPRIETEK